MPKKWVAIAVLSLTALLCVGIYLMTTKESGPERASQTNRTLSNSGSACDATFPAVALEKLDGEFERALYLTSAPGDDALFVVEKNSSLIRVIKDGKLLRDPFIKVPGVLSGGEQGLLGLAFHPDYQTNHRFFVFYTSKGTRHDVIAEFKRSPDDIYRAVPKEHQRLVAVQDSESNHNGGMLAFGPDGFLYAGMGDEGGADDQHGPIGNGLNKRTLFGSLLRLDVDRKDSGFAAKGNPFSEPDRPQVWAYGLRNPWRFSFDSKTGDLWIGDVGQDEWEEINFVPAGEGKGWNFGWRAYEGTHVFNNADLALAKNHVEPLIEYPHEEDDEHVLHGFSVTGGYVYRGKAIPALDGVYLYGDFATGEIAGLRLEQSGKICGHQKLPALTQPGLASFGQDSKGELYLVTLNSGIFKIVLGD